MGYCKFSKFNFSFMIMLFCVTSAQNDDHNSHQDRISLIGFKAWVVSDPLGALESWDNNGLHVCNWTGVKCDKKMSRVVELDLSHRSLRGEISPQLSNLSCLEVLDLSWNFFGGKIPPELGSLVHLMQLSLSTNLLGGRIPGELGGLRELVYLDLGSNDLSGEIPVPLFCNGSLSLQYMDLSNNSLSGEIPMSSHCELRELKFLLLWSNRLIGEVPKALGNSSRLEWIDMESNSLRGELPSEMVSKLPRLQFLYLSYNHFCSHDGNTNLWPFFASLRNSSNLEELELGGNHLGGEIPSIIGHFSTNLVQIHLEDNLIHGPIPQDISNLVNLTLLNLSDNLLNGSIPVEICEIGRLERLYLSNNHLSGPIPSAFGNAPHLGLLDLSKNRLTGAIPDTFANLPQLRRLLLQGNRLSGQIPPSLGQCINLEILDLSRNRLSGTIPTQVAGLRSLKLYLNLSGNHLHGPIPRELSKMDMVLAVDLSSNNLTGTIPSQLGSCIALESLNLSHNFFEGSLPASVGQLAYLKELDVSFNQLSGEIPQAFQSSSSLKKLNFSYNRFSGNVTDKGAFSTLSFASFLGNDHLCGSINGMKNCKGSKRGHHFLITILLSLLVTPIFCIVGCPLVHRSRFRKQWAVVVNNNKVAEFTEEGKTDPKYPRISRGQLIQATADGLLCGSVGYIAPEYGMGKRASTEGDVYSYGVLVLEIVTGKRPTDHLFEEGKTLHEWVKSHYPHRLEPIVEEALVRCKPRGSVSYNSNIWRNTILELIEVGLVCTQYSPGTRPSMVDVALEIGRLKEYLASPSILHCEEDLHGF
nr:putative leucine-rich repeat receptor-like serine/threonine-protein kinase At2g24130 [Ipomoea batatas]